MHVSSFWYTCLLMFGWMCPHSDMYASLCLYACVLILFCMSPYVCMNVSLCFYVCVLILLTPNRHTSPFWVRCGSKRSPLSTHRFDPHVIHQKLIIIHLIFRNPLGLYQITEMRYEIWRIPNNFVLMRLCMCPYVLMHVSLFFYVCLLMHVWMYVSLCLMHVSLCFYACVLILLRQLLMHVSLCFYACVLTFECVCPPGTTWDLQTTNIFTTSSSKITFKGNVYIKRSTSVTSKGLKGRRMTLLGWRILLNGIYKWKTRLLWRTPWRKELCPDEKQFLQSLFQMVSNHLSCVMCHSSLHMPSCLSAYVLMFHYVYVLMLLWICPYSHVHMSSCFIE